jgi:peptidoglycan hydrolase CwlO-like protein
MAEKREEYVERMKRQLDEWNAAIDKLEKRAGELTAEARQRVQARVAALRAKRQEIQGKLKEMQAAGESAWDAIKASVEAARTEFKRAYEETESETPSLPGSGDEPPQT